MTLNKWPTVASFFLCPFPSEKRFVGILLYTTYSWASCAVRIGCRGLASRQLRSSWRKEGKAGDNQLVWYVTPIRPRIGEVMAWRN